MHGWLGTYRLWEQCRPDRQTQGRSRGVLIREKEPSLPSAPDTGLAALHQTLSIPHINTLTHGRRETLIKTEQIGKGSPGLSLHCHYHCLNI